MVKDNIVEELRRINAGEKIINPPAENNDEDVAKQKKKKKTTKKAEKEQNVNVTENTATPLLPTTSYYINSWGYYNENKRIIIEQITPHFFIYNNKGKIGLAEVQSVKDGRYSLQFLLIDGITYYFKKTIYPAYQFYNIPSLNQCQKFIDGNVKVRGFKEIEADIQNVLKQMFDFSGELDIKISSLSIGQSWIKPLLNEFFFFGIDATKGGGKTTLGEIVYFLMRHGFVGGNISSASIPRLITELDLNIFVDEIDQSVKDEDTMAILRKGQRRGNPYVRCEGRDNRPVVYDVAGCHGFSYRSEIEDAFMDRAIRTHTIKSMDYMLPVINSSKRTILKPLADELFFWFIKNISVVGCYRNGELENSSCYTKKEAITDDKKVLCSKERPVKAFSKPPHAIFTENLFQRREIYNLLVKDFSEEEQKLLREFFGRDNELTYLCLKTAKILGFDMVSNIREIICKKKSDESSSESFNFETLKEFIVLHFESEISSKKLKEGEYENKYFYPKNKLYQKFVMYLKGLKIEGISTKKFSSLLRDLGFVEGINLRSQRYGNFPTPCLIFTNEIISKLGLTLPKMNPEIPVEEQVTPEQQKVAEKILEDFEE